MENSKKKRLMTIISGAPLPNFIAINEIKPDIVHCFYTKGNANMENRLDNLMKVIKQILPKTSFEKISISGITDTKNIHANCISILDKFANDSWYLNRTVGTEQMRAPLTAEFSKRGLARASENKDKNFHEFFVNSENNSIDYSLPNWELTRVPFEGVISVARYFELFGEVFIPGSPTNTTEAELFNALKTLSFNDIQASCEWKDGKTIINEFDIIAIHQYKLYIFERKRQPNLSKDKTKTSTEKAKQLAGVIHDIEKLAYMRAIFAGYFGQVYWILSGDYVVAESNLSRINRLNLNFIRGITDNQIPKNWEKYKLPPPQPSH